MARTACVHYGQDGEIRLRSYSFQFRPVLTLSFEYPCASPPRRATVVVAATNCASNSRLHSAFALSPVQRAELRVESVLVGTPPEVSAADCPNSVTCRGPCMDLLHAHTAANSQVPLHLLLSKLLAALPPEINCISGKHLLFPSLVAEAAAKCHIRLPAPHAR